MIGLTIFWSEGICTLVLCVWKVVGCFQHYFMDQLVGALKTMILRMISSLGDWLKRFQKRSISISFLKIFCNILIIKIL